MVKNYIFLFLFNLLFPTLCFAQNIEIKYNVYSKIRKSHVDKLVNNKNIQEYKDLFEGLQAEKEDSFLLVIQGKRSSYVKIEIEEELSDDAGPEIVIVSPTYSDENHAVFKDFTQRRMIEVKDFLSKSYRIEENLPKYNWKLEQQTKEIMGLKCYKAIVGDSIVAWFCPDIPVNDGPDIYCGLPGIIIDLEDRNDVYRCISLNPASKKVVSEPKRCKVLSAEEFEKLKEREWE